MSEQGQSGIVFRYRIDRCYYFCGVNETLYRLEAANPEEGGLFDAHGRRAVRFPEDGHPELCNAVLDITGDCRDEIVVWDPFELWVYTQHDNPKAGRLYRPKRNPLYNYSNYQARESPIPSKVLSQALSMISASASRANSHSLQLYSCKPGIRPLV